MRYQDQFEAKAAARKAANYLKMPMYVFRSGVAYEVSPDHPGRNCIKVLPTSQEGA